MNDGVANLAYGLATGTAKTQDRAAKDGDLRREVRRHGAALEEWNSPEDAEQLFLVRSVGFVVVFVGRLVLDHDHDVLEILAKSCREALQRLLDIALELLRRDTAWGHSGR